MNFQMARLKIRKYALAWDMNRNIGGIQLELADGSRKKLAFSSPAEYSALVALFAQSKLFYDDAKGILGTGTITTPP